MKRTRKRKPVQPYPKGWDVRYYYGNHEPGQEFSFKDHFDISRRAKFMRHVVTEHGEWIDAIELAGQKGKPRGLRSIDPDRVTKWWRRSKSQPSPKEKRKMNQEESTV